MPFTVTMTLTQKFGPAQTLPAGVTLQAIDAETMTSSTTMSMNYYTRSGFTRCTTPFNSAKSWDDPTWFPIITFYTEADTTSNGFPKMLDLGYNVGLATFSGPPTPDYSLFGTNSMWYLNVEGNDAPVPSANYIAATYADEPQTSTTNNTGSNLYVNGAGGGPAGTNIAGGPVFITLTKRSLASNDFGSLSELIPVQNFVTPNTFWTTANPGSQSRGMDITGYDLYFYAGSTASIRQQDASQAINQAAAPQLTADQMARGNNYGCMIDQMRRDWSPNNNPNGDNKGTGNAPCNIPLQCFVENGSSNDTGSGARAITAPEMICAVWSAIIHGARSLSYFYYADIFTLSAGNAIYDATKSTNALIQSLAPVINSPFAKGYVTPSPLGYNFPVYDQAALAAFTNTGFQCCAKWYNGATSGILVKGHFYIFASTTFGESGYTTQTATFTIVNTGATTATVLYSSDNASPSPISISGGTSFTDTFPHPWSVRIYRID